MSSIYVTRKIPEAGLALLREAGHEVVISDKNEVLTKDELLAALRKGPYDAILSLLTDTIDAEVFDAVPTLKVVANYAVGYNNIDHTAAAKRGIMVTNTPGVLTDTVAEFTVALLLATVKRIAEADAFIRAGKFAGWAPELLLGSDLHGKTLGIVGAGRIGAGVAKRMGHGFGMRVIYTDLAPSAPFEEVVPSEYIKELSLLLNQADVVSLHVPLNDHTKHLINADRLSEMKSSAYLINTSRGAVIDELALVTALRAGQLRGAGLDVFEHEPTLASGLSDLSQVVITPHIASASLETRSAMSTIAAANIIAVLSGQVPPNAVS